MDIVEVREGRVTIRRRRGKMPVGILVDWDERKAKLIYNGNAIIRASKRKPKRRRRKT